MLIYASNKMNAVCFCWLYSLSWPSANSFSTW